MAKNELSPQEELQWYAAYTLPRQEKVVALRLMQQNVESYLPLYSETHVWKDRRATVELPLFPSYVFVRMHLRDRSRILSRPGIVRIVSHHGAPAVLADEEIDRLRLSLKIWKATPYPYLDVGRDILIKSGPFIGFQGRILRRRGHLRLLVTLKQIQCSMVLEVGVADVDALTQTRIA